MADPPIASDAIDPHIVYVYKEVKELVKKNEDSYFFFGVPQRLDAED